MLTDEQLVEQHALFLSVLKNIFGNAPELNISIATATAEFLKMEGNFCFQVMIDEPFFDWYCDYRPDNQFFHTPKEAVENYLQYRFYWVEHVKR